MSPVNLYNSCIRHSQQLVRGEAVQGFDTAALWNAVTVFVTSTGRIIVDYSAVAAERGMVFTRETLTPLTLSALERANELTLSFMQAFVDESTTRNSNLRTLSADPAMFAVYSMPSPIREMSNPIRDTIQTGGMTDHKPHPPAFPPRPSNVNKRIEPKQELTKDENIDDVSAIVSNDTTQSITDQKDNYVQSGDNSEVDEFYEIKSAIDKFEAEKINSDQQSALTEDNISDKLMISIESSTLPVTLTMGAKVEDLVVHLTRDELNKEMSVDDVQSPIVDDVRLAELALGNDEKE